MSMAVLFWVLSVIQSTSTLAQIKRTSSRLNRTTQQLTEGFQQTGRWISFSVPSGKPFTSRFAGEKNRCYTLLVVSDSTKDAQSLRVGLSDAVYTIAKPRQNVWQMAWCNTNHESFELRVEASSAASSLHYGVFLKGFRESTASRLDDDSTAVKLNNQYSEKLDFAETAIGEPIEETISRYGSVSAGMISPQKGCYRLLATAENSRLDLDVVVRGVDELASSRLGKGKLVVPFCVPRQMIITATVAVYGANGNVAINFFDAPNDSSGQNGGSALNKDFLANRIDQIHRGKYAGATASTPLLRTELDGTTPQPFQETLDKGCYAIIGVVHPSVKRSTLAIFDESGTLLHQQTTADIWFEKTFCLKRKGNVTLNVNSLEGRGPWAGQIYSIGDK